MFPGRIGWHLQGGEVGVGAGVALDVGERAAEHLLGAVDGEVFDLVVEAAAAIVASAGEAFGVLVGEAGSRRPP
jgi:hypothetical protein